MNMKRLISLVAFFATLQASAQQVNPVPDYVFANRMSAGRNTVTDTAAYLSIGPRYGATRGMMPPMVVDTASFSGNKRNGLLIFSVQKNKFLYWDSVGVKWAEMAGTAGTALTSADTAALLSTRAWRQKGIDSLAAIRIAGSGTTNYIPKFTASGTIGNSRIIDSVTKGGIGTQPSVSEDVSFWVVKTSSNGVARGLQSYVNFSGNYGATAFDGVVNVNSSTNYDHIAVNQNLFKIEGSAVAATGVHGIVSEGIYNGTSTTSIGSLLKLGNISGTGTITDKYAIYQTSTLKSYMANNLISNGKICIGCSASASPTFALTVNATSNPIIELQNNASTFAYIGLASSLFSGGSNGLGITVGGGNKIILGADGTRYATFESSGEVFINTTSDAGDYKLQVSGNIYNTGSLTTGAPSGGSIKPWKIGEAATVSPTSPNRTIRVEIDGVVYYLHAKTTND
jgi:hypothetical protein